MFRNAVSVSPSTFLSSTSSSMMNVALFILFSSLRINRNLVVAAAAVGSSSSSSLSSLLVTSFTPPPPPHNLRWQDYSCDHHSNPLLFWHSRPTPPPPFSSSFSSNHCGIRRWRGGGGASDSPSSTNSDDDDHQAFTNVRQQQPQPQPQPQQQASKPSSSSDTSLHISSISISRDETQTIHVPPPPPQPQPDPAGITAINATTSITSSSFESSAERVSLSATSIPSPLTPQSPSPPPPPSMGESLSSASPTALSPYSALSSSSQSKTSISITTSSSTIHSATNDPAVGPVYHSAARIRPQQRIMRIRQWALEEFPWKRRIPNYLTYARCVAIPLFVWAFYHCVVPAVPTSEGTGTYNNYYCWIPSAIFAVASLTDFLDGYLARKWHSTSAFGAFLDPVADKLMVSTALIVLSGRFGRCVAIPTVLILGRELAVSALREWMATQGKRDTVQVGRQGKLKTALTMVAVSLYLLMPPTPIVTPSPRADGTIASSDNAFVSLITKLFFFGCPPTPTAAAAAAAARVGPVLAQILLVLSSVLTWTSGATYFQAAAPYLLRDNDE